TIRRAVWCLRIVGDMRVTFPRLPDHERAWALVERDDGVVYRLYSGTAGPRLPHDIMHLVVERELRIKDGIWAGIAAGGPGDPPDPRAELLADLVSSAAALSTLTLDKIKRLTADKLAALPVPSGWAPRWTRWWSPSRPGP